jgi:dTDP-glucose 4,6-dehydratase
VNDRKCHDFRYAIDSSKAKKELGFKLEGSFENKLQKTVKWYLNKINF